MPMDRDQLKDSALNLPPELLVRYDIAEKFEIKHLESRLRRLLGKEIHIRELPSKPKPAEFTPQL